MTRTGILFVLAGALCVNGETGAFTASDLVARLKGDSEIRRRQDQGECGTSHFCKECTILASGCTWSSRYGTCVKTLDNQNHPLLITTPGGCPSEKSCPSSCDDGWYMLPSSAQSPEKCVGQCHGKSLECCKAKSCPEQCQGGYAKVENEEPSQCTGQCTGTSPSCCEQKICPNKCAFNWMKKTPQSAASCDGQCNGKSPSCCTRKTCPTTCDSGYTKPAFPVSYWCNGQCDGKSFGCCEPKVCPSSCDDGWLPKPTASQDPSSCNGQCTGSSTECCERKKCPDTCSPPLEPVLYNDPTKCKFQCTGTCSSCCALPSSQINKPPSTLCATKQQENLDAQDEVRPGKYETCGEISNKCESAGALCGERETILDKFKDTNCCSGPSTLCATKEQEDLEAKILVFPNDVITWLGDHKAPGLTNNGKVSCHQLSEWCGNSIHPCGTRDQILDKMQSTLCCAGVAEEYGSDHCTKNSCAEGFCSGDTTNPTCKPCPWKTSDCKYMNTNKRGMINCMRSCA